MFIAKQLKEKNIIEYLLYMWQVEDLIRANDLDLNQLKSRIVEPYALDESKKTALTQWYADLVEMMHLEGVVEKGHLQINKNTLTDLTDLHLRLLRSPKVPFYVAAYYDALPFIVELRAKSQTEEKPELETCLDALYGVLLLRLQRKEVSKETTEAVGKIGHFLALLADYYAKDRRGELDKILTDEVEL